MIADALRHHRGSGVADAEPLSRHSVYEGFAAGSPVEGHVSDNHVLLRRLGGPVGRSDDKLSSGESLAEVVVAVAPKGDGQAPGDERAEALSAGAAAVDPVGILRQPFRIAPGDL